MWRIRSDAELDMVDLVRPNSMKVRSHSSYHSGTLAGFNIFFSSQLICPKFQPLCFFSPTYPYVNVQFLFSQNTCMYPGLIQLADAEQDCDPRRQWALGESKPSPTYIVPS